MDLASGGIPLMLVDKIRETRRLAVASVWV